MGEIVGAIAVVATLAYLARQINIQNRAHESETFEGFMDGINATNARMVEDRENLRLLLTGMHHPDSLDGHEARLFSMLFRLYVNDFMKVHRAYERGAMPPEMWRDFAKQFAAMTETPGGRIFFDGHADVFSEFISAIREHHTDEVVLDLTFGRGFGRDTRST